MKKLYFFLLAATIGNTFTTFGQEAPRSSPKLGIYPLAHTLQDYTKHEGAVGLSLFTIYHPKRNGRIAICNFNAVSFNQDSLGDYWYESLLGASYASRSQKFQVGLMVGGEKREEFEFKVSPWVYLESKNERWKLFAAYEQGKTEWSLRFEGSYLVKEWEHLELEVGVVSHEMRIGADFEFVYKSFNLYVAPVMIDMRTGNLGGMLGIGRKFGPSKSFPSHRSKGGNHEVHRS